MSTFVNELELIQIAPQAKKKVKRKPNKLLKRERFTAFMFILPPVISFSIFTVIPLFVTLLLAFGDFNILTFDYKFVGFKNFVYLLNGSNVASKTFLDSVVTTLCFIIEVPIAIFLGLLCATLANSKGCKKTNTIFRVLLYLFSDVG